MDTGMIGAMLTTLVSPLLLPPLGNTISPENVAKSLNWLISTADDFLTTRKASKSGKESVPVALEKESPSTLQINHSLEEYLLGMYETQVQSYLEQLNIYAGNIRHLQSRIADSGGTVAASIADINQLKRQRQEIGLIIKQLSDVVKIIYDTEVPEINKIANLFSGLD